MKITIGYPSMSEEADILCERRVSRPVTRITPVSNSKEIIELIQATSQVNVERAIADFIVSVTARTRTHAALSLGASPRASLALMRASQGRAFLHGRDYVLPEDALEMCRPVITHRLMLTQDARLRGITEFDVMNDILSGLKLPYVRK
jgi:MoxR-like ATPase